MRTSARLVLLSLAAAVALALPVTASADVADAVSTFTYTKNMHPLGFSERAVPFTGTGSGVLNSDLAFWGKTAIQGHYAGFRIIDIADPENPVELMNYTDCVNPTSGAGGQGDIVVYRNILVRAWDSGGGGNLSCGGIPRPAGQEGSHIFDISDPAHPVALAFINTAPCGTHTLSGVPDLANDRLLIYSSPSSGNAACTGFHIFSIPLANPAAATNLGLEPSGSPVLALPNLVDVHGGGAAGTYPASGSQWHPDPTVEGVTGPFALVNAAANPTFPAATPSQGCGALVGFPENAIALVDRGTCSFLDKVMNAEAAGAIGVVVINNAAGNPITMGGETHEISIPSAMISQDNGTLIRSNLPASGTLRRHPDAVNMARACHDTAVILGSVMKATCAGGNGVSTWSLGGENGGSLDDPELLYSMNHGTGIGHTAAFTWDGEYIVFGHEPGGGTQARCEAVDTMFDRTIWFLDAETGEAVGEFMHPRPQTNTENCTWHNLNVVPTDKRYVFVSGNYQSGISVVDFTDVEHPREIAFADPAPLVHPTNPAAIVAGGDWSTYWYNGFIYESDIRRGLIVWKLSDNAVAGAKKFAYSNPQTQETSFGLKR